MGLFGGLLRGFDNQPYNPAIPGSGVSSPPLTDQGAAPPYAAQAGPQPVMGMGMTPPPAAAPTGMFGSLGKGRVIAGLIGDALQSAAGGKGSFLPFAAQQHQDQQLLARQGMQQQAEFQRQLALKQYDLAHPADDEFTRTIRAAGIDPVSPEGRAMFRTRANTVAQGMNALPQMVTIPGVGTFAAPRGGAAPGPAAASPAAPPDEAVARLRSNPHEAAKFDEIFGMGASARYLNGGAAPTANAPFPIR